MVRGGCLAVETFERAIVGLIAGWEDVRILDDPPSIEVAGRIVAREGDVVWLRGGSPGSEEMPEDCPADDYFLVSEVEARD